MNDLPKGWELKTLGDIAKWSSGGTPPRKNPQYYEGDIAWIKTGDLGEKFITQTSEYITQEAINNSSAKLFPKGSVALAMYGATIGKTSILGIDATTNQACAVAIPNDDLNNEFLYYLLLSEKDNFILKGQGGAQPNISQTIIKEHPVCIPPLDEQIQIATLLDNHLNQLDQIKEKLTNILPIIKQFRQSVLVQAVSGRLLAGLDFENWQTVKLSEISHINPKKDKLDDDLEVSFSPMNLMPIKYGEPLKFENKKWAEVKKGFTFFKENDVLVAKITPCFENGKSVVATNLINGIGAGSTEYHIIRTNENTLPAWVLCHFKMESFLKEGAMNMTGSVGHKRVPKDFFENFELKLPPLSEQTQIVQQVEHYFAKADQLENHIKSALENINHMTQSLLHQAFIGNLTKEWRA